MITVEQIDTHSKKQVNEFISLQYRIYKNHPQWVPPLYTDARMQLNREKHPYYKHSDADFFVARKGDQVVGRVAALENRRYNAYHNTRQAQFYLFDCENDLEIANALFTALFDWAKDRGLNQVVGPKGFGALDGYGLLIEGFEYRQMMTMMNYNYPYYKQLIEALGFEKVVDFVSCYINTNSFQIPERILRIAERVQERGTLAVHKFETKQEIRKWAEKIGKAYNNSFINNWEYYPLTDEEIAFLLENILAIANPRLIKVITHDNDVVGFLFGFPDLSAALQRAQGRLLPFGIIYLLSDMKRTKWIALNGAGILPKFHGHGGNALLYSEMMKTVHEFNFEHADLTQIAETAVQMRHDLENIGGKPYKNHRVYKKDL